MMTKKLRNKDAKAILTKWLDGKPASLPFEQPASLKLSADNAKHRVIGNVISSAGRSHSNVQVSPWSLPPL